MDEKKCYFCETAESVNCSLYIFEKIDGNGAAILFSNVTEFYGRYDHVKDGFVENETKISFTLKEKDYKVVVYYPEIAYELIPDANGVYSFILENTDGAFITAEPVAEFVESIEK